MIFLTAHSDASTLARAMVTEPFGYILKPYEERELQTAMEIALYKHRSIGKQKDAQKYAG